MILQSQYFNMPFMRIEILKKQTNTNFIEKKKEKKKKKRLLKDIKALIMTTVILL